MSETRNRIGFLSRQASHLPHMASLLGAPPCYVLPGTAFRVSALAGWGRKPLALKAQKLAARKRLPFLTVEDGFLRSVERDAPPLSIVVDDLGIYYDATKPSRLEMLVAEPLDAVQTARARSLIEAWRRAGVSKYNYARDYAGDLPPRYVLVCDQTFGDASIEYGMAGPESFSRMLAAARIENPDCRIVVKTHPDVFTRAKRGYFAGDALGQDDRLMAVAEDCHPSRLIDGADCVYTVTSQMGFEALMRGKRVRTFGMPFYAGWGLTDDELPAPSRRGRASLEQLVHASLVAYPRYVDPETGRRCEVEDAVDHIALQRQMRSRFPAEIKAIGFSRWKQPILRRFLSGSKLQFRGDAGDVRPGDAVAVWGNAAVDGLPAACSVLHVEDGFLRSVGLGAKLVQPLSWIFDDEGVYFDASRPSRLERIVSETVFDETLLDRARALRARIVEARVTKYNSDPNPWQRPDREGKVILVPGQVEEDASIRFGAPGVRTNIDLLKAVRASDPAAYIVYKPHPDVVAGLRPRGRQEGDAERYCDEVVAGAGLAGMLEEVDEVHVMTSLAGFEALLRGKKVTCFGIPFYAGWGLTTDIEPIPRRVRKLMLDELVAAALILYPTYVSRVTGRFTTPERAVDELIDWREGRRRERPFWRRVLPSSLALPGRKTA